MQANFNSLKQFWKKIKTPFDTTIRHLWTIVSWIWSALIITALINAAGQFLASDVSFNQTMTSTITGQAWEFLRKDEFGSVVLRDVLLGFLVLSLVCFVYVLLVKKTEDTKEVLYLHNIAFYLKAVAENLSPKPLQPQVSTEEAENERLALQRYHRMLAEKCQQQRMGDVQTSFLAQPGTLPTSLVSLTEVFVEPHFIPDRPIYDTATIPQDIVGVLPALAPPKKRVITIPLILQTRWSSQQNIFPPPLLPAVTLERVLLGLSSGSAVAVILGPHGSGKTTLLRWLAQRMAQELGMPDAPVLSSTLPFHRTPIFLSIAEYTRSFQQNQLTVYDYIANTIDDLYPDLATVVLKELRAGRCLLLLDGLDALQTVDVSWHQRIIDALQQFIAAHTVVVDPRPGKQHNYILLTSRIVAYPQLTQAAFLHYPHYTLEPLNDADLKKYIVNYTSALTLAQCRSAHISPVFTSEEQAQSQHIATEVTEQLLDLFQQHQVLQQLARNPDILLRIIATQINKLPLQDHLFQFYQSLCNSMILSSPLLPLPSSMRAEKQALEQLLGLIAGELYKNAAAICYAQISSCYQGITLSSSQNDQPHLDHLLNLARMWELLILGDKEQFCFPYAALQTYYAANALLSETPEVRRQQVERYCSEPCWREVFLLMLTAMDPLTPEYSQLELLLSVKKS